MSQAQVRASPFLHARQGTEILYLNIAGLACAQEEDVSLAPLPSTTGEDAAVHQVMTTQ